MLWHWLHVFFWYDRNSKHWILKDSLKTDFTAAQVVGELRIYSLAVGQGDCTILICPENKDLFILDMGSVSSSGGHALKKADVQDLLKSYVNKHKSAHINIAVTHADNDHYNWLSTVFGDATLKGKVDHFILGGDKSDYSSSFITWAKATFGVSFINNENQCYGNAACTVDDNMYSTKNDHFPQFCNRAGTASAVKFEAMVANKVTSLNSKNAQSLVTVVDFNNWKMMLPGDFETKQAQDELVNRYKGKLRSHMYKLAHHGASNEANFANFLKTVNPVQAFVSQAAPDTGTYHHPRCEAMKRLLKESSNINTLPYALHYDFPCYDGAAKDTVTFPAWTKKDLHLTCPGDDDQPSMAPYCSTLKIVSDGNSAKVWYIRV